MEEQTAAGEKLSVPTDFTAPPLPGELQEWTRRKSICHPSWFCRNQYGATIMYRAGRPQHGGFFKLLKLVK